MRKAVALLLLCVLAGCSRNKMDHATAESLTKRYLGERSGHFLINIGRVGTACPDLNDKGEQEERPLNLNPNIDPSVILVKQAGYVTIEPDGDNYWKVNLTDAGKKAVESASGKLISTTALNGCDYKMAALDLAVPEPVNLVSVVSDENGTEIKYTWKWTATNLGKTLRVDGKFYQAMTESDRLELQRSISGLQQLKLPIPADDAVFSGSVKFKQSDKGWQLAGY